MSATPTSNSANNRSAYDRLFQKPTGPVRSGEVEPEKAETEIEATDDLGAFGWLRGIRDRAISLELRKKTGNIVAIPYMHLERLEFDPSSGITLYAGGQTYRIKGRNLNAEIQPTKRLWQGLVRCRVPWIQEADRPDALQADKSATVVESIEW